MFTGSIAVPRPGGEGCSRVVGSLSAVLGCGLVFPFTRWGVGLLASTFCQVFVFGDRLRSLAEDVGFPFTRWGVG